MTIVTPEAIESLVDMTSFKTVLNYVENPKSEIEGFVNVEEQDLCEIGAMFINGTVEEIEKLIVNKDISFRHLPHNEAVNVLYLPPYYVVKPLNKEYK